MLRAEANRVWKLDPALSLALSLSPYPSCYFYLSTEQPLTTSSSQQTHQANHLFSILTTLGDIHLPALI